MGKEGYVPWVQVKVCFPLSWYLQHATGERGSGPMAGEATRERQGEEEEGKGER